MVETIKKKSYTSKTYPPKGFCEYFIRGGLCFMTCHQHMNTDILVLCINVCLDGIPFTMTGRGNNFVQVNPSLQRSLSLELGIGA